MSEREPEARIRDLKKRVEKEPGSRYFVPLAEEYRRAGRISDALSTLEEGLVAHPSYVSARVALARTYLEAGRTEESMAAFSKALADDPSNLVAAKALGDLYLSRGEPVEALKRYLRYRGISGDHRLDDVITRLQGEVAPAPPYSPPQFPAAPPPPPSFRSTPLGGTAPPPLPAELARPYGASAAGEAALPTRNGSRRHFRDHVRAPRHALRRGRRSGSTLPRSLARRSPRCGALRRRGDRDPQDSPPRSDLAFRDDARPRAPGCSRPAAGGRALGDLYFAQGHFLEARSIYEELLAAAPTDGELLRLRDEASRRAADEPVAVPEGDPSRERRLARVRLLNEWIGAVRSNSGPAPDKLPE